MLADLLTKPLGGELYHNLTQKLLGGHRYECLNNRGAKGVQDFYEKQLASVEYVVPALAELSCSNHTYRPVSKKHITNQTRNGRTKQQKSMV
jgi:hypothetical protein